MLQYLLNATAIWLISLISYDVFLRRESYHTYNRFYLLFTFLLGAFLPVWQWQNENLHTPGLQKPLQQVIIAKENIVSATVSSASWNWPQWLAILYMSGAIVAVIILAIDIIKLSSFYNQGVKSKQQGWTIIETGTEHAPFSFLNTLFISAVDAYSEEEWSMILLHEKRHTNLLHFADLLLMQLARIFFWFHPLVYVYNKRLLLVHEYQADTVSRREPEVYGRFLIEQALLQTAPSVSHSFNRSPIKKRIIMLTRRSSAAAKTKMFVFLPLAAVCILCFSKNSFSQKFVKNGNTVTYRGNTFELSKPGKDTIQLMDPVTGKIRTEIAQKQAMPIKMNGKEIPQNVDKHPYFIGSNDDLQTYVLKSMKEEVGKLEDGSYTLYVSNIVIDNTGKVVYFDYGDVHGNTITQESGNIGQNSDGSKKTISFGADAPAEMSGKNFTVHKSGAQIKIDKDVQNEIFQKICNIMNENHLFLPATQNGEKVTSVDNSLMSFSAFKVKDHKLYKRMNYQDVPLN